MCVYVYNQILEFRLLLTTQRCDIKCKLSVHQNNKYQISNEYYLTSMPTIDTSVCQQLHVLIVKVQWWTSVRVSKCQRADGFVRPVAARSFAVTRCRTTIQ